MFWHVSILFFRLISFREILKFITIYKIETSDESFIDLFINSAKRRFDPLTGQYLDNSYRWLNTMVQVNTPENPLTAINRDLIE